MLATTPRDEIHREGSARLLRFRRSDDRPAEALPPVLLVPSLINRWYVLDLSERASLSAALSARFDTYCLDWGVPGDEDRYLSWDAILRRLSRAVRLVSQRGGRQPVTLVGYCMGATLAGIHAALSPEHVGALVNLAGPFDFSKGGILRTLTDRRWFDAEAIAAAGNVPPHLMQAGFQALRPTAQLAKQVGLPLLVGDDVAFDDFVRLETWANDNVPFPAEAYSRYVRELYQENGLVAKTHFVSGRRVDLGNIRCPVLTVVASKDTICPPAAATALNDHVGSKDHRVHVIPGGHVSAVVGPKARQELHPVLVEWIGARTRAGEAPS